MPASSGNRVVHFAFAGGPDLCAKPGCDGNYSLAALIYSDGSMSGQYTDRFANGDGFHAKLDCVYIVGRDAWVSGVITSGTTDNGATDLTGASVWTRVQDNGTSKNSATDKIFYSVLYDATPCYATPNYGPLVDAPNGQVIVK